MNPDPDQLVLLTTFNTEFQAQSLVAALDARAIRAKVFSAAARVMQWEGGIGNQVKVFVRRGDAQAALETMRTLHDSSRGIDWNLVDVGEMEPGETPPLRVGGARVQGLSPVLWRLRMLGFSLMAMPALVAMMGPDKMALVIVFCVLMAILAEPGVPVRATAQRFGPGSGGRPALGERTPRGPSQTGG